jgi:hypothetical protein
MQLLSTPIIKKKSFFVQFESALIYLLGIGAILSLGPYFIWNSDLFKVYSILALVPGVFYFLKQNSIKKKSIYLFVYFLLVLFTLNFSSNGFIFYISPSILLISLFLLISNEQKIRVYHVFFNLFTLSLIPGLALFLLSLLGIDFPWESLEIINGVKGENGWFYRNYWGAVVLSSQIFNTGIGEIYRFSAIYDEPGVVGTVSALLLVANGFKLETIRSKIILISGMISFSLAFYVLITIYIFLKRPILIVKLIMPILVVIFMIYGELKDNTLMERYLFDRIEQAIDDPQSKDNRVSSCFQSKFDSFIQYGDIYTGNGANAHSDSGCSVSSYITIIYNHGYIGFILIIIFFIFLFFILESNLRSVLYLYPIILVFILNFYQRPEFFSMWMIVIFSAAILNENRKNSLRPRPPLKHGV